MLRLQATPLDVHERLADTEAVRRLLSSDALDQATNGPTLLASVVGEARALGATRLELDVERAGELHDRMAAENGFVPRRELLRMGRSLPTGQPWELTVRPFEVDRDEEAWLAVNNRAFAWHPDQSNWDLDTLRRREAEPWFDPDGFLLHERDGRLAGFCWTKIHAHERPPLGEIYVIAVDPDFHGRGLGRPLVLAGLDWLADQGLRDAILYVEGDNTPAVRLYENLGFSTTEARRWWTLDLTAG
jgi:mycothiol synthase